MLDTHCVAVHVSVRNTMNLTTVTLQELNTVFTVLRMRFPTLKGPIILLYLSSNIHFVCLFCHSWLL